MILKRIFSRKQNNFDHHFKMGQELYRRGDLDMAVAAFVRALKCQQSPVAYLARGLALARLGDLEGAINDFQRVVDSSAERRMVRDAAFNLGKACRELGRYREALVWFDRVIAMAPEASIAHCDRAGVRIQLAEETADPREYERAVADLDHAISLDIDDPISYWNRAIAYEQLSESAKAAADVKRFLSLAPPDHPYREEAKRMIERLTTRPKPELDKKRQKDLDNLVKQIIDKNDREEFKDAILDCDRALKLAQSLSSEREQIYGEKATALWGTGRINEALECVERGTKLYPQSPRLWHTMGCILGEMGKLREALGAFQKYVAVAPPDLREQIEEVKRLMEEIQRNL